MNKHHITNQEYEWLVDYFEEWAIPDLIEVVITYMPPEKIREIIEKIAEKFED